MVTTTTIQTDDASLKADLKRVKLDMKIEKEWRVKACIGMLYILR